MSSLSSVGGVNTINGHIQTQRAVYTPPPRQPDDDSKRYTAETNARTQQPAVQLTLSPEAQKALAGQQSQTAQT